MIETPQIVRTETRPTAVIRLTAPRHEIQQVMGPAMQEVIATVRAQGVGPAGPLFSHHFRMQPDVFDFEVGVPVSAPVTATGRVIPGELPATTAARTVYRGDYSGLGRAWGDFDAWLKTTNHRPAEELWETYVAGPEASSEPDDWRTELHRPLR